MSIGIRMGVGTEVVESGRFEIFVQEEGEEGGHSAESAIHSENSKASLAW